MATNATSKSFEFTVSVRVGVVWKVVAKYTSKKASLPQSIAAFYKFFEGWKVDDVEYRFDSVLGDVVVWSDSHIPYFDSV